jgi:multiple sugar transport system substrate-binding protein
MAAFTNQWALIARQIKRWAVVAISTSIAVIGISAVVWSQDEPVTITFLVRAVEAQQLQMLADAFEQENPDINIDMVEGPNAADNVENLYTTSFLLG